MYREYYEGKLRDAFAKAAELERKLAALEQELGDAAVGDWRVDRIINRFDLLLEEIDIYESYL